MHRNRLKFEITDITCVAAKNQGNDIQSEMD